VKAGGARLTPLAMCVSLPQTTFEFVLRNFLVLDKLERRFGRFAIPNLTTILIAGQVVAYLAAQMNPDSLKRIALIPQEVLNGQVYRLLTFLVWPPGSFLLFAFFFWYLFYLMGTALEYQWGTFRYNVFLVIGYIATVATSFLTPYAPVTNTFFLGTVFLAFAYLNPNFELRLFFILPVQIKWFALLAWITFALQFAAGPWTMRIQIAASLLNFFIFFGRDIYSRIKSGRRQMTLKSQRLSASRNEPGYFHICAACGLTDKVDPKMDFRYCSHCSRNEAYCSEHLKNHEHTNSE
jgi:hypothetical protein